MTIEITSPELEAMIRQRMQAGAFDNPEDVIREAFGVSRLDPRTGASLIEVLQSCPHPEVDIEPARLSQLEKK